MIKGMEMFEHDQPEVLSTLIDLRFPLKSIQPDKEEKRELILWRDTHFL